MTTRLLIVFAFLPLASQGQSSAKAGRLRSISFLSNKPGLGLPANDSEVSGLCSSDGLTYFEGGSGPSASRDLYTVSTTAEVNHLQRKLPLDATEVIEKSFYPAEHMLVTLLEADQRDKADEPPRRTEYLLSTSDQTGAESELLSLRLPFKPLKAGAFASGDFVVLGWDTANQLPLLARLKEDGTVRKFIDLADLPTGGNDTELRKAAFVPYGGNVLLTFPGTTRPARLLMDQGEDHTIALPIPGGYVLHDVIGSDGRSPLVARVQERPATKEGVLRLMQFETVGGALIRDLVLEKVPVAAVTCSVRRALTAVWLEAAGSTAGDGTEPAKQLVIGTARR